MDDRQEQLEQVLEAASDYLMALRNEGFAKEYGGVDALLECLKEAVDAYEAE